MNVYSLAEIASQTITRFSSGWDEMDWAYGRRSDYGLPRGAISLWAGARGIGKTRLLTQLMIELDKQGLSSLIFQGEVSPSQFKGEKMRGYVPKGSIWVSPAVSVDAQCEIIQRLRPDLVIIDSVQQVEEYNGGRGGKQLVRKLRSALAYGGHLILVSHLTQGGQTKGGTELPHEVDIECHLSSWDSHVPQNFKLVVGKNRYGKSGGEVVFQHRDEGVVVWSESRYDDRDWVSSRGGRTPQQLAQRAADRKWAEEAVDEFFHGPRPTKGFWGVVGRLLG